MKNNDLKSKKRIGLIVSSLAIFILLLTMVVGGLVVDANEKKTKFTQNVYINGSNVRGYTAVGAEKMVYDKMKNDIDGIDVNITYKDKSWHFDESDFEIDSAIKDVVSNAFKTSKTQNSDALILISQKTGGFKLALNSVLKNFDKKIDDIVSQINKEPIDASVTFNPNSKDMFKINEEECGIEVLKDQLVDDLEQQFLNTKKISVEVKTKTLEPKITKEYFADKLNLQSKFSTSIKNSQQGRRNNVSVALSKVNGAVIKPNEIVSFNALTSPQDASGGYQNAIIILNGVYTNGMGGGICQASTTLYNALVLANLEIEEVHKHTIPVHYVEHALDAMISDGYADLIFKNTSQSDVYIKSYVSGDDAVVEIYGKTLPDGITIKRVAEETKISHPGDKIIVDEKGEYSNKVLYKGEYYRLKWPSEGYDAKAYKEYYKGDKLVKREEIRHETYQPQQGIVIEGAKPLPEGFVLPESDVTIYPPQDEQ